MINEKAWPRRVVIGGKPAWKGQCGCVMRAGGKCQHGWSAPPIPGEAPRAMWLAFEGLRSSGDPQHE